MTTSPRLGYTELTAGQATPETRVNEMARYLEQGASKFIFKSKTTAAEPGSPADGDCYLLTGSPTGTHWSGQANKIAFYESTAWVFLTAREGYSAYVNDTDLFIVYDGSSWNTLGLASTVPAEAANSDVWAGSATTKYLSPAKLYTASAPVALTSSATITADGNNGFNFSLTLAHNATLANPSNFKTGQSGAIVITQDGTGSRTLAYGSQWKFPGGSPVLTTAAGGVDVISYFVSASGSLIVSSLAKAFS